MAIQVYNTLTKRKDEFKPIEPGKVNIYMCGPTVYDYFHIGNARSFIMSDVIRKYFEFRGFEVNYIMNITDIDDKIIKRANERNVSTALVSKEYTEYFFEDIERLSVSKATLNPRATEHIPEMIQMIDTLINKGYAYQIGNDIYYNIEKFEQYGKLSGKNIEDLIAGARVNVDETKKNPLDFALWKGAKEGEPYWESPWGKGRPGWHIECSAMAMKYHGETIDIHCGGNDLIFPHHENEIAQSESVTNKPFSNYWIHFGFLNIDNEKMSKSLGNFFTTREILQKYSSNVIRLYFLQTHYTAPLNFTHDGLEAAKNGYERLLNVLRMINTKTEKNEFGNELIDLPEYENRFIESMDDDFNTPKAISVLFDLTKHINSIYSSDNRFKSDSLLKTSNFFSQKLNDVFGINYRKDLNTFDELGDTEKLENLIFVLTANKTVFENVLGYPLIEIGAINYTEIIDSIVQKRNEARINKNWALSDKIRDDLKIIGIAIEDRKDKSTGWKII